MDKTNMICQILNYNDIENVEKLVNKIRSYKIFDFVLIVDNNSTDNSFNILKNLYENDAKIKIIRTSKNGGYGYGNNFGIDYAYKILNARYAVIANPDVDFSEKMVEALFKLMREKNAAITSGVEINKVPSINKAWKIPTPMQWMLSETKLRKLVFGKFHYSDNYFKTKYSEVECVSGAMFLLNLDKFRSVHGYDEEMFLYGEETALGYKFKKKGYKTYLVNTEYYNHLHSASVDKSIPDKIKQMKILHKSKMYFCNTYLGENIFSYNIQKVFYKYIEVSRKIVSLTKN